MQHGYPGAGGGWLQRDGSKNVQGAFPLTHNLPRMLTCWKPRCRNGRIDKNRVWLSAKKKKKTEQKKAAAVENIRSHYYIILLFYTILGYPWAWCTHSAATQCLFLYFMHESHFVVYCQSVQVRTRTHRDMLITYSIVITWFHLFCWLTVSLSACWAN